MVRLEIKKNVQSFLFVISVFLLYTVFLFGDSGAVLMDGTTTTIIGAIWNKFHGNWLVCSDSSCIVRMYLMWTDNTYLPVLMPLLCGLPSVINYLRESETGNKKWILSRCSLKEYYSSKIVGNVISAVMIALVSVVLYYITLFLFFDRISIHHEAFSNIYFVLSGRMVEGASKISWFVIWGSLVKGMLYFCIYAVTSASFCMWMAIWCKDQYLTFGAAISLCYLQNRVVEELIRKYVLDGITRAGVIADVLNPTFLHFAGNSGFYQEKEWLAVVISILLICFHYFMIIWLSQRRFDLSEG